MLAITWRNWITHTLRVGMWNDTSKLENSLIASYKTKHTTTIWSRKWTLGHLSQRHENLCSYKNLCMNVHHSFIHHSQKLEIVQMSFNRCINCGTFVPWNVLTIKKNELLVHTPTQRKLQEIILIGKKISQSQRLHAVPFCYKNREQTSVCQELRTGGAGGHIGEEWEEDGIAIKGQHKGSSWRWKHSVS